MLRLEKDRLVIEVETPDAAWEAWHLMHDIVYAMGAIDKEQVDSETDCIFSLCNLLRAMLPSEEDMEKIAEAKRMKSNK